MAVTVSSSRSHLLGVPQELSDDPDAPSGQLLLWYFLGLAAVQPVVLWLQAAALAVVLNVLRHMPEQKLQSLLGSGSRAAESGTGGLWARQSAVGTADTCSQVRQGYQVFLPLSYAWRAQWTWMDWLRFRLLKHSLDIVLVSACLSRVCGLAATRACVGLVSAVPLYVCMLVLRPCIQLRHAAACQGAADCFEGYHGPVRQHVRAC